MREDVEDGAGGIADEEAPHAPGLVGELVDDLAALRPGAFMDAIDVVDLDRKVGHRRAGAAFAPDTELWTHGPAGGERQEPAMVHDDLEIEQAPVECAERGGVVGREVGDDAADGHRASVTLRRM